MLQRPHLVLVLVICCYLTTILHCAHTPLKVKPDGTFRLLQFTDMHFGESAIKDLITLPMQEHLIEFENPDFVVLTGDVVSNYAYGTNTSCFVGGTKNCWKMATSILNRPSRSDGGRPYAVSFGNHDINIPDITPEELIEYELRQPNSYSQAGPSSISHETNYVLEVHDSEGKSVVLRLWLLDSGADRCEGVKGYDCIRPDQVEWYRSKAKALNEQKKAPAIAFFHIPLQEHMNVWDFHASSTNGTKNESVCCWSLNTGAYSVFKEVGDVKLVTVGHDHNDDYIGDYYGISLAYGRKTGMGGYFNSGGVRGCRVIEFNANTGVISSWIREETGRKVIQTSSGSHHQVQSVCCSADGSSQTAEWWQKVQHKNCQNRFCEVL